MTNSSTPSDNLIANYSLQFVDALDHLTDQISFIKDTFLNYNLFQPHYENENFISLQENLSEYIKVINLEISAVKELYDTLVVYSASK